MSQDLWVRIIIEPQMDTDRHKCNRKNKIAYCDFEISFQIKNDKSKSIQQKYHYLVFSFVYFRVHLLSFLKIYLQSDNK